MYWNVPRTVPFSVRFVPACVRSASDPETPGQGRDARESEVHELYARLRQHDVAGLQVAVDDPLAVRLVQRVGDLDAAAHGLLGRQMSLEQAGREAFALQELHDEVFGPVVVADVVERADVRMGKGGDRLRLAFEALPDFLVLREVRRQHCVAAGAVQARVLRPMDFPASARTPTAARIS
jgi:hypothetical protein